MKHYLPLMLMVSVSFGAYAQAARDSTVIRRNIVKLNPLSLVVGDVSFFYERVLSRRSSLVGGVGFGSESFYYSKTPSPGQFTYRRLTLEYRHYLGATRRAPVGFYWGLYTRYAQLTLVDYVFDEKGEFLKDPSGSFVQSTRQVEVLIPGALVGGQAAFKRLTFDGFFGVQYQLPSSGIPLRSVTPELMSTQRLAPRYGVTVGFRF